MQNIEPLSIGHVEIFFSEGRIIVLQNTYHTNSIELDADIGNRYISKYRNGLDVKI